VEWKKNGRSRLDSGLWRGAFGIKEGKLQESSSNPFRVRKKIRTGRGSLSGRKETDSKNQRGIEGNDLGEKIQEVFSIKPYGTEKKSESEGGGVTRSFI